MKNALDDETYNKLYNGIEWRYKPDTGKWQGGPGGNACKKLSFSPSADPKMDGRIYISTKFSSNAMHECQIRNPKKKPADPADAEDYYKNKLCNTVEPATENISYACKCKLDDVIET